MNLRIQLDALVEAAKLPHRSDAKKVFLLITDASFHSSDSVLLPHRAGRGGGAPVQGRAAPRGGPGPGALPLDAGRLGGTFFDKDSGETSGRSSVRSRAVSP